MNPTLIMNKLEQFSHKSVFVFPINALFGYLSTRLKCISTFFSNGLSHVVLVYGSKNWVQ